MKNKTQEQPEEPKGLTLHELGKKMLEGMSKWSPEDKAKFQEAANKRFGQQPK